MTAPGPPSAVVSCPKVQHPFTALHINRTYCRAKNTQQKTPMIGSPPVKIAEYPKAPNWTI